ncbi:MAG TPA: hypothetical protein VD978_27980 [Azospirillum sp.]|nr:hypothetical protein [Azospirillum sp.]
MARLALDPFTPEQPLKVAQQYVALIHNVLERRNDLDAEHVRRVEQTMELIANRVVAEVRYDAERLMYLAERAASDGFPVHEQLIEVAAEHEAEIKRLGNEVIREYKALSRKLQMPQKVQAVVRDVTEAAERFQDEWLTIIRQMRHRALAIGRRRVPDLTLVVAGELYTAALAEAGGTPEEMSLRPSIAGDMIVYEMIIPVARDLLEDTFRLAAMVDAMHDHVENMAPHLCGGLALRFVARDHAA